MGKSEKILQLSQGQVKRRPGRRKNRELRRSLTARNAAGAIGPITPNCEIYGLCKGQYSLIDIISHCLAETGPAKVVVSTWTAAGADIDFAYKLLTEGRVKECQFLVDFSFPSRQPEYCRALVETFGNDAIRITKNHAKFVLIINDAWHLVIRSSMNLNENRRLESFEISDDKALSDYLEAFINDIFANQESAGQMEARPMDHMRQFEGLGGDELRQAYNEMMDSQDTKRFYGNGPYDNDLRRVGQHYLR